jgi:hypothetical protein
MGGVSRQNSAATFPPDRFYCLLDELPLHLVPRRALNSLRTQGDQPLYLNPGCVLSSANKFSVNRLPEELAPHEQALSALALQGTIAWVRDAAGNLLPFWLGPRLEAEVRSLAPDEPVPTAMPHDVRAVLCTAGILVPTVSAGKSSREREATLASASRIFREKGYAPLPDLIHPFHIAALRRYYRYLVRTGTIRLGDGQSPRRYVAYNEPVACFFHHYLTRTFSAVAGEPVKPSYVYLASYLSGAQLKKHTDREQCEFSITLCLDFSPEPALETPWPIRLDTPKGTVAVYQALGDGLAYRGTRLPHYRDVLEEGRTSTSIFFHYVAENFAGSLD